MNAEELAEMLKQRLDGFSRGPSELYHRQTDSLEITSFDGEIASCTRSHRKGAAARVAREGKIGSAFTEELTEDGVDHILAQADEQIDFLSEDRGNVLYPGSRSCFDSERENKELLNLSDEYKKDFVLKLERAARALDKRISTVPRSAYGEVRQQVTIVNSFGMKKSETYTYCGAVLQVAAKKGKQTHVYTSSRTGDSFFTLSPLKMAQEAVMGALGKMNPRGIESGSYPAVLSWEAASGLFGACLLSRYSHLYADNVLKDRSRFSGMKGEKIASSLLTLWDNPSGSAVYSRAFDDEGFPAKRFMIIREGILKDFPRSVSAAALEGSSPTGHSLRNGYGSRIETGLHAPCIACGEASIDELFHTCAQGIYITELDGLHSGVNPVTGEFSLSARGYFIEGGKQGKPVGHCTIAGNVYDCLRNIVGTADDRRTDTFRRFSSPSVLLESLDVSG